MHLRSHHSRDTPFLCPVSECDAGPLSPDLLWAHLIWHRDIVQFGRKPQIRAIEDMYLSCPVQGCNEKLATYLFWQTHRLIDHDMDSRKRDASAILAAGFNPTSGRPICPVCDVDLEPEHRSEANSRHFLSHDWNSLYNQRREILRVWPWFIMKADFQDVFEDILPTGDARQRSSIRF